ncbi:ATXN7L3 [Cordylochernes scorpioides]|uniref:SAGA-associated factor 11 homolog n=1 Tax=Cordylochernes scorpioides TaxID=51811 RepID=A0ABY6LBI6_9ARAC|nr:ATXN7L3 [Cordylochernes scorpioides]UYV78521.1 ATXN7L3 [Cordylochernes scorpioides]
MDTTSNTNNKPQEDDLELSILEIFNDLRDEVILGLGFDVHRAVKLGFFYLDEPSKDNQKYEIVDEIGKDVFGQVPLKKQFECVCPNCERNLAASRFAPHLEKCLGMGRNSSRIASKRIANTGKAECSDIDDFDNDQDWNYVNDRKQTKRKRDKNSPRRTRTRTIKTDEASAGAPSDSSIFNFETRTLEEKKSILSHVCGVISEHTKKMCTRSQRCPQHTDEQRRSIRNVLLGSHATMEDLIDVDTLDDTESQLFRLWENNSNNSSNPSPADSNSAANGLSYSGGKRKTEKVSKSSSSQKKSRAKPSAASTSAESSQPPPIIELV